MDFHQTFSPLQFGRHRLANNTFSYEARLYQILNEINGSSYNDLDLEIPEHIPLESMASNPILIGLLQFIIKFNKVRSVLELGTYIGASAIKMAQAMPSDGFVKTIEMGEEFYQIAKRNFVRNITDCVILAYNDDALNYVRYVSSVGHKYDLIFLDCDKQNYNKYFPILCYMLNPGGTLVIDDVFFDGDVFNNPPTTEKGLGCQRLLTLLTEHSWPKLLLPIVSGVFLTQRPVQ